MNRDKFQELDKVIAEKITGEEDIKRVKVIFLFMVMQKFKIIFSKR